MLCAESSRMARSTRQVLERLEDGITQRVRVPLTTPQRVPVCALCSAGTAGRVAGLRVPASPALAPPGHRLATSARTVPIAVCSTENVEGKEAMQRRQVRIMVHVTCWACVLAVLVSGTGQAASGPRLTIPDLEKQATAFLRRLGFAIHGEVVCVAVSIGTQAYVCQALGIPQSPSASLQKAHLLAFYCSPEGVCWFAPERVP